MTKQLVTFVGDTTPGRKKGGPSDPTQITVFGLTFELDQPTPINFASPESQKILAKLRGNHHFRVEDVPEAPEAEKPKAETPAERKAREKAAKASADATEA